MSYFIKNEVLSKDYCVHLYSGISEKDITNKVDRSLHVLGYKQKSGMPGNGEYVKGNRTMRILLGAFHKYFKFSVSSSANGNDTKVTIGKKSSGMSGGLIGVSQVKKEMKRIAAHLERI
jgi:hypothetical protein